MEGESEKHSQVSAQGSETTPIENTPQLSSPRAKIPPVRFIFLGVLLIVLVLLQLPSTSDAKFRPSSEAHRQQFIAVIDAQLAAFRANDWTKARSFAAPLFQQKYPVKEFEEMVRNGYPLIARSASATFGVAMDNGKEASIDVIVHGKGGGGARYQYFLLRDAGQWKINGVKQTGADGPVI